MVLMMLAVAAVVQEEQDRMVQLVEAVALVV
jgi:hypothetical protein